MSLLRRANAVMAILFVMVILSACTRQGGLAPLDHFGSHNGQYVIVRSGDTVYDIAHRHKISMRSLIDANALTPPYHIRPGQKLRLPTPNVYVVRKGDSLSVIAAMFDTSSGQLARLNRIKKPYVIYPGQTIRLPAGSSLVASGTNYIEQAANFITGLVPQPQPKKTINIPAPPTQKPQPYDPVIVRSQTAGTTQVSIPSGSSSSSSSRVTAQKPSTPPPPSALSPDENIDLVVRSPGVGRFVWPVNGRIISTYGPKDGGLHNDGLNIEAEKGTAIRASAAGEVIYAGNELRGYGNLLLVRHEGGWVSAYAHLSSFDTGRGAKVSQGQIIGRIGKTGGVPKPQLHFELRKSNSTVDPMKYLPSPGA